MPQPFKTRSGQTVTSGASVIISRPECAIAIVQALGSWAHFEDMLRSMFNSATALFMEQPAGPRIAYSNGAALRAYQAVETLHLKHVVMSAAFRRRLSADLTTEFEKLMRKARTCVAERNDLAHALWAIVDAYPKDILRAAPGEQFGQVIYTRYTVKDFDSITARIQSLMMDAFLLSDRIRAYVERFPGAN